MKIDERATKAARSRQAKGENLLKLLFGFTPTKAPLNLHTGRVDRDPMMRLRWRQWRDSTFPERARRRKRRKIARASRKANRR